MSVLNGVLLFGVQPVNNTGPRIVIQEPDGEIEAELVGVLEDPVTGEVDDEVIC